MHWVVCAALCCAGVLLVHYWCYKKMMIYLVGKWEGAEMRKRHKCCLLLSQIPCVTRLL